LTRRISFGKVCPGLFAVPIHSVSSSAQSPSQGRIDGRFLFVLGPGPHHLDESGDLLVRGGSKESRFRVVNGHRVDRRCQGAGSAYDLAGKGSGSTTEILPARGVRSFVADDPIFDRLTSVE